jgi:acetyl esterase
MWSSPASTRCATGIAYAARLREAGVPVCLRVQWGLIHGFVNATGVGKTSRRAVQEIAAALREGLR